MILAIILGFVTIFYMTDWPREATWLPEDEKRWIIQELETEKQRRKAVQQISMWQALKHRDVLLLVGAYFFATVGFYGLNIWLPTILKGASGWSDSALATGGAARATAAQAKAIPRRTGRARPRSRRSNDNGSDIRPLRCFGKLIA